MDWSDEELVNDFAIDMCFLSVKLRSEILRRTDNNRVGVDGKR